MAQYGQHPPRAADLEAWVESMFSSSSSVDVWAAVVSSDPEASMTPLALVCQFKFVNAQLGTTFSSATARRLIEEAGCDVNSTRPSNGVRALLYAAKYGDVGTVKLLLEAGAEDGSSMSALMGACEVGRDLGIVQLLLAAEEQEDNGVLNVGQPPGSSSGMVPAALNCAEKLLLLREDCVGWRVLGRPTVDTVLAIVEALIIGGHELGPAAVRSLGDHFRLTREELASAYGENTGRLYLNVEIAKALLGHDFNGKKKQRATDSRPPPRGAIETRGACVPVPQRVVDKMMAGTGVPYKELSRPRFDDAAVYALSALKNRGPKFMTDEQLAVELKANRISIDTTASSKARLEEWAEKLKKAIFKLDGNNNNCSFYLETATTQNVATPKYVFIAPADGPLRLSVLIKGVPVVASLSTTSSHTFISRAFADRAGVVYSETASRNCFQGLLASGECFLARELPISFGGVDVNLGTAVVSEKFFRGVQLGMDFLAQAVWEQLDGVRTNGGTLTTRPATFTAECMFIREQPQEQVLRFHSPCGRTAVVPLLGCYDGDFIGAIGHKNVRVEFCAWCGRKFPGLQRCAACDSQTYYCSKPCQKAHWPEHKLEYHQR